MRDIVTDFSDTKLVKTVIKANWENYHYCLGRSSTVELSVGRYLTWFITKMPDDFMNLVVCTELPSEGIDQLIENTFAHFRDLNIKKLSWLIEEGISTVEIKKLLEAYGLTESFVTEMAADLLNLREEQPVPEGLSMMVVRNAEWLRQWIHVASIGFGVSHDVENVWYECFETVAWEHPFRTYLALLNGKPVGTSQLFTSAGVAGIYNVTCLPEARGQGIGAAVTLAPLLEGRKMGYRVGILQASSAGRRVYKRLGFEDFGDLPVYRWDTVYS